MDRILSDNTTAWRKGFTLLEVMVALAVLAIALTSIYKLQGRTILMSSKARFLTVAPHLAQSKLAEIERSEFNDISNDTGEFGPEYPRYTWKVSVEEVATELTEDRNHHLLQILIDINQGDDNFYQLKTYRFYVQ